MYWQSPFISKINVGFNILLDSVFLYVKAIWMSPHHVGVKIIVVLKNLPNILNLMLHGTQIFSHTDPCLLFMLLYVLFFTVLKYDVVMTNP